MASLNVLCAICNEFYKANDIVYSTTTCGHVFHQTCLMRWLARSLTCPQCRANCHRRRVHRIYLNFGERCPEDDITLPTSDVPNWVPVDLPPDATASGLLPDGAIKAGTDPDGNDAYVARVYFEEDLLPANYVPAKNGAYTPWNCRAHFLSEDIEVLVDCDYKWVASSGGTVPPSAVATGYTEQGENLYTGRAQYQGISLPGKIHPSHGVLYMPYEGQEVNVAEYEVLVQVPKEHVDH